MTAQRPVPPQPAGPPSLWKELAEGTAGVTVRLVVSVALGGLLAGLALFGSFVIGAVVPGWASPWGNGYEPRPELVAFALLIAAVAYIAGLVCIWTRNRRKFRVFWRAGAITAGVAVSTLVLCFAIEENNAIRHNDEILVSGVVCIAGAIVLLVWLQAGRRHVRGRPIYDPIDGTINVRCPSCGYRMTGLHESRCPECGESYTLDQLIERQEFLPRLGRTQSSESRK